MPPNTSKKATPTASIRGKLRDIFSTKAKGSSDARPPQPAPPSRIPVRTKRGFQDVTVDETDVGSALNPRARIRQRVDSTLSIATIRPSGIPRKPSTESVKTIKMGSPLKRSASTGATATTLNPGTAPPATAVLTRVTSRNGEKAAPSDRRSGVFNNIDNRPPPRVVKDIPSLKAQTRPGAMSSRSSVTRRFSLSLGTRSSRKSAPSSQEQPSSLVVAMAADAANVTRGVSSETPDGTERYMDSGDAFNVDVVEIVGDIPDEDDDADAQLTSQFTDDEEIADAIVAKESAGHHRRHRSLGTLLSIADGTYDEWFPGRFEVKIQPCARHTVLWDISSTDGNLVWPGLVCVTDTLLPPYDSQSPPPIRMIDIEFRSVDDSVVVRKSGESVRNADVLKTGRTTPSESPGAEYAVEYLGYLLEQDGTLADVMSEVTPGNGICIDPIWQWIPPTSESKFGQNTLVDAAYALRFYVPVPLWLLERREHRRFRVTTKITFGGWDLPPVVAHSRTVEVAIEHLRKEVHMDGKRPLSVA